MFNHVFRTLPMPIAAENTDYQNRSNKRGSHQPHYKNGLAGSRNAGRCPRKIEALMPGIAYPETDNRQQSDDI